MRTLLSLFLPCLLLFVFPGFAAAQGPTWAGGYPERRAENCVWSVAQWSNGTYNSVPFSCPPGVKPVTTRRGGLTLIEYLRTYPERGSEGCVWYVSQWKELDTTYDRVYDKVPHSCPSGVV